MSDTLNEENGTAGFDPYGLSDIEKIQREIESDLSKAWPAGVSDASLDTGASAEASSAPAEAAGDSYSSAVETASVFIGADTSASCAEFPAIPAAEVTSLDATGASGLSQPVPNPLPEPAFYRETIKEHKPPRRRMSWRRLVAVLCVVCTLGTGTLGLGIGAAVTMARHYLAGGINNENSGDNADGALPYGIESTRYVFGGDAQVAPRDGSLSDVIKLVEPSVVSVSALFETNGGLFDMPNTGDASGIIFAEDAQKIYIATNYHVVNGAAGVNVSITGSDPLAARLVGRDADADLAVISVEKKDLQSAGVQSIVIAVFGDSDTMEVGDAVLAIGNAMGEGNSATSGIISSSEKTIPIQNRNLTVLQTDAAINFGNSGGPLVNTRGEVIGINTAKLSTSYYAVEGMAYSISSNVAKPILEELMSAGPKPFLGIEGVTVTEEISEQYGIPPIGVLVTGVFANAGAEKAGIVRTDIITSFNGAAVFTMNQLADEVKKCKIGDSVEVKILRDGATPMTLMVKLSEYSLDSF